MSVGSMNVVNIGVYGEQLYPNRVLLKLENNVEKTINESGYSWKFSYSEKQIGDTAKVVVRAERISRYTFDEKVFLEVKVGSSTNEVTNTFEIEKRRGKQMFETALLKRARNQSSVDKEIKVTLHLHVEQMEYFGNVNSSIEFNSPSRPHDAVILVDSKKFYVQKVVLATWSNYFDELFFVASAQNDQKEFRVAGCNSIEFLALLQVIHPSTKEEINEDNIASLMMMAEKFKMLSLEIRCGNYLMNFEKCATITLMNRLRVSDQMKHAKLQVACLEKIHTLNEVDFKQFFDENSAELKLLSNATIRNLF